MINGGKKKIYETAPKQWIRIPFHSIEPMVQLKLISHNEYVVKIPHFIPFQNTNGLFDENLEKRSR